ncbi:protease inhibitor I42 family protein [Chloroflexota bacterium]
MKKLLILVMVVMITTMAGCVFRIVKPYSDAGQAINIGIDQEFAIVLGSNPTTGYGWQESYDSTMLELMEKKYIPGKEAKKDVVGAGGADYFRFKALKTGETRIGMVYKQPWEGGQISETKAFIINIR